MKVAAVFALKEVYRRSGFEAFNSVLKLKFAATSRTWLPEVDGLHGVPPWFCALRRSDQFSSNEKCGLRRALSARHKILAVTSEAVSGIRHRDLASDE
jgi:hypothetical protein